MRVLLAPHGTRGDVQPMLALAIALRARGHDVTFLVPDNSVGWIRAHGFAAIGNGIDVERLVRTSGAMFDSPRWQMRHFADVLVPRLFAAFAGAPAADVIVGAGVQLAGASVAAARDVPYLTAGFCPCMVPSGLAPPPTIRTQTLPRWINSAIWTIGRPLVERLIARLLRKHRRAIGLRFNDRPIESVIGDHLIVAADPDLAPMPDDLPADVSSTDAWILDDPSPLDPRVEAFLSIDPAPIYVGFGSMVARRAGELARQTLAAVRSIGGRAIVAGGWAELDRYVAADTDVLIARSLPHATLFPRVAAVVHHGGAGTTTAAARAGKPQVVLPHILDQFYWARRVEAIGIGPRALPVTLVTADVLAARLDEAVNDPRVASHAAAVGDAMRHRDGVAAAVELVESITLAECASRSSPRLC